MSSGDTSRARGLMAARLGARTAIDPTWQYAFAQVPREAFLPERVWFNRNHRAVEVKRSEDPDTWWSLVCDEERSIIIQLDDGRDGGPGDYSSSSTQPYTMARMPALLPDSGRVLEIGSGSGYNAAVMAHRFGAENVVSVEVDPAIAAQAREAMADAGYPVEVEGRWICTVWDGNGSWAVVAEEASDEGWRVRERGPRNLWRVVEHVHKQWLGWGEPSPDRFRVSITAAGAFVLLDSAKRTLAELPVSRERAEHVRTEAL